MVEKPGYEGNPNIAFIPLSLANVYLNRYEWRDHIADLETSIKWTVPSDPSGDATLFPFAYFPPTPPDALPTAADGRGN